MYTWMFIATLSIIAKTGNNLDVFQQVNVYINCNYIHTMEYYYSETKINRLFIYTTIWMDLKGIMLNKKKPILKVICYMIRII